MRGSALEGGRSQGCVLRLVVQRDGAEFFDLNARSADHHHTAQLSIQYVFGKGVRVAHLTLTAVVSPVKG